MDTCIPPACGVRWWWWWWKSVCVLNGQGGGYHVSGSSGRPVWVVTVSQGDSG